MALNEPQCYRRAGGEAAHRILQNNADPLIVFLRPPVAAINSAMPANPMPTADAKNAPGAE
jgi:hypothetical protein